MTDEKKPSWKEQQKVSPRVKDGVSKNALLHSREATKVSKKAYKQAKKDYKLSRKTYKNELKKHKFNVKKGDRPLSINHIVAKKKFIEDKKGKKVAKRVYQKTKAKDSTRISVQIKGEARVSLKQDVNQQISKVMYQDDLLGDAKESFNKAQRAKQKIRVGFRIGKNTGRVALKAGKSAYGIGNRTFNFSRGRGFHRTPENLTTRKQLMYKFRNHRQRMKAAKAAKKAEKGIGLVRSVLTGKKSALKAMSVVIQNPITWIVLLIIIVVFTLAGVAGGTQKPAIVQDDVDLTDSWTYMTKLDAEHSDDSNQFYSNIDDVMFHMNYRFDEYKLLDMMDTGTNNYEGFLKDLWDDLNGNPPDYSLKTMDELEKDKKSEYYISDDEYEHYQEVKKELGYTTLDDPLAFPFETDSLIVSRRYGYEKKESKETLFNGIEILAEAEKAFNSPMSGMVSSVPSSTSLVIEKENSVRLTIEGVKSSRFKGNEEVQEGTFLGNSPSESVTLKYEKYDPEEKEWYFVNPAFYFPNVTYTQTTMLGSSDFDPGQDVESRARAVYDYLTKLGYKKEGIAAILGNFSVESGINPKRAEGDYLNPPVGATANSWDNPSWLAMGGMDIYGKFPNIVHRGLGLGQWTDTADGSTRHTLLLDYAKGKNKKWYDLQLQLDFIFNGDSPAYQTMAANTAGNKVSSNVAELTVYFLNNWEGNPGDKTNERIQAAQNWFNFLSSSGNEVNGSSSEVFEKYKEKMKPLPTDKEVKEGQGWPGNNYALGNCTWYVYNRMAQLGKTIHPTMGNANQWVINYILTPGAKLVSTPRRGDAVIFTNGVAGSSAIYGHVAFVEYVNSDGTFVISEMNVSGEYSMSWRVLRKEAGEYFMRVN
ncbi:MULTISPECIES: phage tail tip lysozyme [unclassified Enterococcus]|uniref:phage tail tip lysozyme n=1 Tax=unclassified Enterococcus TaxID=2608891 RepID=UPI001CE0BF3C|nr:MULTISPECIES: phage tail tip lysozyme [unclassified Enterococcus]MCA5014560.1 CHAP domain-containing protein [Enterococcus sp. S23]MCA5017813.1 CHAP domain-containing protein [Enterococcus sp. S22(2020)]